MWYLRKTMWALVLIILAELIKKIMDSILAEATVFTHNFLSAVQVVTLLWLILLLASGLINSRESARRKIAEKIPLLLFFILIIPEFLIIYWLHHPSKIPSMLIPVFRQYYGEIQRNIIQFNPDASVYDSSLFYTLKPSSRFVFDNYEFSDTFSTNKLGLRDDDSSLINPRIICAGDSYTMGWGVQQDETFAEHLSSLTGKKVLNAGISSYGTARELKNLCRLDTSALEYIIIQYSRNDETENKQFVQQHYSLKISPEATYNSTVTRHFWSKAWFPGKHLIVLSKLYVRHKLMRFFPAKKAALADSSSITLHESAKNFADMLLYSSINFKKIKVLVTDINEQGLMNDTFLEEVKKLVASWPYLEHFNHNLIMIPVTDILNSGDYYILDDHLRASGHQKIAARLNSYILPIN